MTKLSKKTLDQWYTLRKQLVNGWHMSTNDWSEIIRLNHEVLESSQEIHNRNMINDIPTVEK